MLEGSAPSLQRPVRAAVAIVMAAGIGLAGVLSGFLHHQVSIALCLALS